MTQDTRTHGHTHTRDTAAFIYRIHRQQIYGNFDKMNVEKNRVSKSPNFNAQTNNNNRQLIKITVAKKKKKRKVKKKEHTEKRHVMTKCKPHVPHQYSVHDSSQKVESNCVTHGFDKDSVNETDEFENDICFEEIPHEIILAIRSLKSRHQVAYCPSCDKNAPPIALILKPMLHDIFLDKNQTNADESFTGIEMELKNSNPKLLQPLKLHGTSNNNDIALMETIDYISGVKDAHRHFLLNNPEPKFKSDSYIAWFVDALLQNWYEPSVSFFQIEQCFSTMNKNKPNYSSSTLRGLVDHLLNIQILIPHTTTRMTTDYMTNSYNCFYWFSLPKLGTVSKALTKGRTKLITTLKWAPQKQLKRSTLDTIDLLKGETFVAVGAFVIRDWIARQSTIKLLSTPNGEFIQLR